ncbi:MAG: NYN domain-containing protein [Promethearchaeati archaeon SRVP18_Atabeyarchaeia-1]
MDGTSEHVQMDAGITMSRGSKAEHWEIVRQTPPVDKKIAVLVDGPNMLRKEFNVKLEYIREPVETLGNIVTAKVFLNTFATDRLLEAIANSGFTPVVTATDIYTTMAVEAMEVIATRRVNTLAIASRHARCAPIIRKAKEKGVESIVIGFEPGFSTALQNASDYVIKIVTGAEQPK